MEVTNIIKYGSITDNYSFNLVLKELDRIQTSNIDNKINYILKNMDFQNHLSFDVIFNNDDIVTWAGLYHRPIWNKGVCRISNRVYVNPKYRSSTYQFLNNNFIIPEQLEAHKNDLNFVFISREQPKAKYYFSKLRQRKEFSNWQISPSMINLVPGVEKQSVYQYILYKFYKNIPFPFSKAVDEYKWKEMEK